MFPLLLSLRVANPFMERAGHHQMGAPVWRQQKGRLNIGRSKRPTLMCALPEDALENRAVNSTSVPMHLARWRLSRTAALSERKMLGGTAGPHTPRSSAVFVLKPCPLRTMANQDLFRHSALLHLRDLSLQLVVVARGRL